MTVSGAGTEQNVVAGNYVGLDANGNGLAANTVSWWKAEGNAADAVDGNAGVIGSVLNFETLPNPPAVNSFTDFATANGGTGTLDGVTFDSRFSGRRKD